MRRGASGEPVSPIRRCRLPDPPKSHTVYQDPVQRLFAFAWLQEQTVRRQAEEEQHKEAEGLSAVIAAQHCVATADLNLEEALEFIALQAASITGAGGAAIALRQGREVVCRARAGLLAPDMGAQLDPESGISGECLRTGEVLACEDTEVDARVNLWACRRLGVRSILAVPLKRQDEVLGIMEVFSGWAGVFTERDVRTLKLLAGLVVEALWREGLQASAVPAEGSPVETAPQPELAAPVPPAPWVSLAEVVAQGASESEITAALPSAATVPQPELQPEHWVAEEMSPPVVAPLATAPATPAAPVAEIPAQDAEPVSAAGMSGWEAIAEPAALAPHSQAQPPPAAVSETTAIPAKPVPAVEPAAVTAGLPAPGFEMVGSAEPFRIPSLLIAVLMALVVVGGAGVSLWRAPQLRSRLVTLIRQQPRPAAPAEQPSVSQPSTPAIPGEQPPVSAVPQAPVPGPGQVLSVQYWSKPDSTSVAIFLDAPVAYEAGALSHPERIYFDLKDTKLAPELRGKSRDGKIIEVNDALVRQIRVGPREPGMARVVIDLKASCQYSAVLSPTEPYRLMIAIRGPNSGAQPATPQAAPAEAPAKPSASLAAPVAPERRLAEARGLKIVIDPGHGGSETGAIGRSGLKEKDLVLGVAKRLGELLTDRLGAEVTYTRTDDRAVSLETRAEIANRAHADLFVSVHANSSDDPSARGVETYYTDSSATSEDDDNAVREDAGGSRAGGTLARIAAKQTEKQRVEESRKLATDVQQALYGALSAGKHTLRNRGVKKASFTVLLDTGMPSILAEIAFVTSPTDERKLKTAESQETVAQALYRGISRYISSTKRGKVLASLGSAGSK